MWYHLNIHLTPESGVNVTVLAVDADCFILITPVSPAVQCGVVVSKVIVKLPVKAATVAFEPNLGSKTVVPVVPNTCWSITILPADNVHYTTSTITIIL